MSRRCFREVLKLDKLPHLGGSEVSIRLEPQEINRSHQAIHDNAQAEKFPYAAQGHAHQPE